eukprot:CAMPEP_0197470506 /NCGR_PEP_ID=MMETSP1309-20131121/1211_1 /TAXON_ID=464262 /ORGANISM="Genus nov. species nov., Strain RCC998" /LENGTH=152 /DNA_ID=CAMNT_0043007421 /DNA_START=54 /DNA_END=512 /DNA_ORIENTATION=-
MIQQTLARRNLIKRGGVRRCASNYAATRRVTSAKIVLKPVGDNDPDYILRSGLSAPPPVQQLEISSDSSVVGRDEDGGADIIIPIPTVSGSHAKIEMDGGKLYVTDLKSTNGTFINNERIEPDAKTEVGVGANIIFGDANLASYQVLSEADD